MTTSETDERILSVRLDQNLDALTDNEWVELAVAYKTAFAGEPWYEVGKCALGAKATVPEGSPCVTSRLSPFAPGSLCSHCNLTIVEEAYPLPTLVGDLEAILRGRIETPLPPKGEKRTTTDVDNPQKPEPERERILYRERSRKKGLLLAAMFWRTTRDELIKKKYADKSAAVHELIKDITPHGKPILYLDEIFADRSKRERGNLWNFGEMCRAAGHLTGTDVVVFRTKSAQLKGKTQTVFPDLESVLPGPDLEDDRHYIVIHLRDLASGQGGVRTGSTGRDPGFAEWLPAARQAEQQLIDLFKHRCELHGFAPIETPAIESMELLSSRGGIDRQIFTVGRPIDDQPADRGGLGLHFDLTVPLARYVTEHFANLHFPFRRYQVQKVWRGEKESPGRFREFYQFDFDVVGDGDLSHHHEAEILQLAYELLTEAGVACNFLVSDSRFLLGMLEDVHPPVRRSVLRTIQAEAKAGPTQVRGRLERLDIPAPLLERVITVLKRPTSIEGAVELVTGSEHATSVLHRLKATLDDLERLGLPEGVAVADLSLIRDLDYYTGFIFETVVPGRTAWGSICSGGRYDDLVTRPHGPTPGVGASIGLTRLFSLLMEDNGYGADKRQSPAPVMLVISDWDRDHSRLAHAATALRATGIGVELALEPGQSIPDATDAAERKGGRYLVYATSEDQVVVVELARHTEVRCTIDEIPSTIAALSDGV